MFSLTAKISSVIVFIIYTLSAIYTIVTGINDHRMDKTLSSLVPVLGAFIYELFFIRLLFYIFQE